MRYVQVQGYKKKARFRTSFIFSLLDLVEFFFIVFHIQFISYLSKEWSKKNNARSSLDFFLIIIPWILSKQINIVKKFISIMPLIKV